MSLALAIPVKDDAAALRHLLKQAHEMALFSQVVIIDDGSASAVDTDQGRHGPWSLPITVLRHETPLGPGVARNRALTHVTTDYLVYLDSDDRFAPDFAHIWHEAFTEEFDICVFRHHDTRQTQIGRWGQMPQDDGLWHRAGLFEARGVLVDEQARVALAETANYPWNKIYRTRFLRDHGLGCAETFVHEDIALHWQIFLRAERLLASSRVGVVHQVASGGQRLTNLRGAERLEVFAILQSVLHQLIADRNQRDLVLPFLRFTSGLFDWIADHLAPDLVQPFQEKRRDFLCDSLCPALEAEVIRSDPVLALRLALQMAEAALPTRIPHKAVA